MSNIRPLIVRALFCVGFSVLFSLTLNSMILMDISNWAVAVCSALTASGCFVLYNTKVGRIVYPILYGGVWGGLVLFYAVRLLLGMNDFADDVNTVINVLVQYVRISQLTVFALMMALCVLVSTTAVLLLGRKLHVVVPSVAGVVTLIGALSTGSVYQPWYFVLLVCLLCALCAFSLYETHMRKPNAVGALSHALPVYLVALITAAATIAVSLPMPASQDQTFTLAMLSKDYYKNNGEDVFSLAAGGLGNDDEQLGGKNEQDDTVALTVTSDHPFYAVASYKDYYDGNGWYVSNTQKMLYESSDDINLDTKIASTVLSRSGCNGYVNTIEITYQQIATRSIVKAPFTLDFPYAQENKLYFDQNNNLYVNQMPEPGYRYSFRALSYDWQEVYDFLNSDAYTATISKARDVVSTSEYQQHLKNIEDVYTIIPYDMPQRIDSLSQSIVHKAGADTRVEQVLALCEYLEQFEYTLDCPEVKMGTDFVDQFLFVTQKGYCTYYASALAMMARTLSIPSRYCEGFAPMSSGTYELTNKKLHAWVEIYFEGVGWIPFEPTPPYTAAMQNSGQNLGSSAAITPEQIQNNGKSVIDPLTPPMGSEQQPEPVPVAPEQPEEAEKPKGKLSLHLPPWLGWVLLAMAVTFFLLLMLALRITSRTQKEQKLLSLSGKAFAVAAWQQLARLARFEGADVSAAYTVREQLQHYKIRYGIRGNVQEILEQALYSEEPLSGEQTRQLRRFYRTMKQTVDAKIGKVRRFVCRYLLHKI